MNEWPKKLNDIPTERNVHGFTMLPPGKFDLMERAYRRYKNAEEHREKMMALYEFFDNAFHVRDWFRKFKYIDDAEKKIEAHISGKLIHQLCRDLANKFKHVSLNKPSKTANIRLLIEQTIESDVHYVAFDDDYMPIEYLMEQLIADWREFQRLYI